MAKKRFKIIYLEITNACNFTCDYCPIDQQTRKKGMMPTELAMNILDQIADHDLTDFITFHIMGEPYLHKDVAQLAAHAEARGLHLRLLTNGSLLDRTRNEALFGAGLTRLEVGFRTPNDTAFSLRLRGGNLTLAEYLQKTKDLVEDKLRLRAKTELCIKLFVRSHMSAMHMADPYEHLTSAEDNIRIARELQTHTLSVARELGLPTKDWENRPIIPKDGEYPIFPGVNLGFSRIQDFWVREQRGQNDGIGDGGGNGRRYYNSCVGGCSAGFRDDFGILVTGEVTSCCVDYDAKNIVGDLRKQSLMEVLDSSEAIRFRHSLERFIPPTEFCKKCLGGPTLTSSIFKQVSTIALDVIDRFKGGNNYQAIRERQRHNDLD